jgi:hypothetical protein
MSAVVQHFTSYLSKEGLCHFLGGPCLSWPPREHNTTAVPSCKQHRGSSTPTSSPTSSLTVTQDCLGRGSCGITLVCANIMASSGAQVIQYTGT